MGIGTLFGYAAAALIGALSTYIFAASIEARRVAFQQHLDAAQAATLALRRWREAFVREWFSRQLGRGGRFPKAPADDLEGLASSILLASERMPSWKASLVRKGLVAFLGDAALLAHWLGPLRDAYEEGGEDSWFSALLELGNHFDDETLAALSYRAQRFAQYDHDAWTEIWQEASFLERAISSRWWHRSVLSVQMTKSETKALREFGLLRNRRRTWRVSKLVPLAQLAANT